MDQRLVSENIMQCNDQIDAHFSAAGHLIAYRSEGALRLKAFNKDIRDCSIKLSQPIKAHHLAAFKSTHYLSIEYDRGGLQIYQIYQEGLEIKSKSLATIPQCSAITPHRHGLLHLAGPNRQLIRLYNYQTGEITSVGQCPADTRFICHEGLNVMTMSNMEKAGPVLQVYDYNEGGEYESPRGVDYVKAPIGVHLDRYVFEDCTDKHEVQIYDIQLSKLVGKFEYVGTFQFSRISSNVLMLITNNSNVDKYYFLLLKSGLNDEAVITNRVVYEKGKGSSYAMCSIQEEYGRSISSGKGNFCEWSNPDPANAILLYVQPKNKTKIEVMSVPFNKIKENHFREESLDMIIHSKLHQGPKGQSQQKMQKETEALEMEKVRVGASMQHRKGDAKNLEQIQRKMIDHLVDVKVKVILERFTELEKRLTRLEDQIGIIYGRIEKSIQNFNKEEIKKNVEALFERVTPQFQSYFSEVFRQISGVLDQGVNYYTDKLAKEAEINRDALNQVINMTFDATQEIVELGRKELKHSESTESGIAKLLEVRKKWEDETRDLFGKFEAGRVKTSPEKVSLAGSPSRQGKRPK